MLEFKVHYVTLHSITQLEWSDLIPSLEYLQLPGEQQGWVVWGVCSSPCCHGCSCWSSCQHPHSCQCTPWPPAPRGLYPGPGSPWWLWCRLVSGLSWWGQVCWCDNDTEAHCSLSLPWSHSRRKTFFYDWGLLACQDISSLLNHGGWPIWISSRLH